MTIPLWSNYFVLTLAATGRDGHIRASDLRQKILNHNGSEAYHCAFDLEDRPDFNNYKGPASPALGYVWFDFDSHDGGELAFVDTKAFCQMLNVPDLFVAFSGNKGFHVGCPFGYFGLNADDQLCGKLQQLATQLKQTYKTLDTTIYNPNRKFRVLGSRHPKTGLYKCRVVNLELPLEDIKILAKTRGDLVLHTPELRSPLPCLLSFDHKNSLLSKDNTSPDFKKTEDKTWNAPDGTEAFLKCGFLAKCQDNPTATSEPEWYAALSVVARFKEGRKQCHQLSYKHPKYTVHETNAKIDQALSESGPRTCDNISKLWDGCARCPLFNKITSPINIYERRFWALNKNGDLVPQYAELLNEFQKQTNYFLDPITEKIYTWNCTHYEEITEIHVNAWCEQTMKPAPSGRVVNEFRAKILRNSVKTKQELNTLFFVTTLGKLNLKNGVLNITTGDLVPHSDKIGFRYVLPYSYDPSAKAPLFEQFLDQVTLSRPALQKTLLEFMGYCLWPSYDDHAFLWLSGGGRNGKSTLGEIIQELMGEDNCSNVLLASFDNPNYLQMMDHKLVNIGEESDAPKIPAEIMGTLKALSAGAKVQVDQKFQVPYAMRATAKLIFAANKPPILSGTESAIKSRMIIVPFDLQLEDHSETETVSKIDWELVSKMKAEMPGILNLCLSALNDFVRRSPRKIYRSVHSHVAMNEIMRDSDAIEAWVQDYIEYLPNPTDGPGINLADLYNHFMGCQGETYKMEMAWFARRLRHRLGSKCDVQRVRILGKQTQILRGIQPNFNTDF